MAEFELEVLVRELDAGGNLTRDQVCFLEPAIVSAANQSRRLESIALHDGKVAEALREHEVRRGLLFKLDKVRRLDGAVGSLTSRELDAYRLGTGIDILDDAHPEEINLGRERRVGPKAKPSPM